MELGVSLYPEQESLEEMRVYLQQAGSYGFTKIFTSMFSVPGEADEVSAYFKTLCEIAHEQHMEVCVDANAEMFKKFGATHQDLRVFKEIGIDEIRMDFCFGDERDQQLVENTEGIKIQFSAFMMDLLKPMVEACKDVSNIVICHNFYPERYTGASRADFMKMNDFWKGYGIPVTAFISSNVKGAHGPWPVYDGLPTLEEHRDRDVAFQVREMMAMGNVDCVIFGNAFASEAELQTVKEMVDARNAALVLGEFEQQMKKLMPNIGENIVSLNVMEETGLNDVEKAIVYEFKKHCDLGDSSEYMLRSRITRMLYGKQSIPHRVYDKPTFTKGDVLVVNDNLKHYCGELQICQKNMRNDGQRNCVGHLNEDEMELLAYIKPGVFFTFHS